MSNHTGNDGKVYVSFGSPLAQRVSVNGYNRQDPKKIYEDWLKENNMWPAEYGRQEGLVYGVFLDPEDAVAFKLRFGL